MIPAEYHDFVIGSSETSASLLGLLFVAVSLSSEGIFGENATAIGLSQALSAFTSLANVFFVSLIALLPGLGLGGPLMVIAALSLSQTASALTKWRLWREDPSVIRAILMFLSSAVLYGCEFVAGVNLQLAPHNRHWLTFLCGLLIGMFVVGLFRAWELMGASHHAGLLSDLRERIAAAALSQARDHRRDEGREPPAGAD